MVKLFPHLRRNTDVARGGDRAAGFFPHPAIHMRRASDGSAAACPSRLSPPAVPPLLIDPILAEAMAAVIKAMQKPSKLSSDHFEAALGIAAIGADSSGEQSFLISNSGSDRRFCALVISRWAESCRATSSKKVAPTAPSKIVADLLRKAAGPLSRSAYRGQSNPIERQLEFGLRPGQRPVFGEVLGGPDSSEEDDAMTSLGRQFDTVASALLSALRGLGWEYDTRNLHDSSLHGGNVNNDVSSSSSSSSSGGGSGSGSGSGGGSGGGSGSGCGGSWGTGVSQIWATASEGSATSATRPAAAPAPTEPTVSSTARKASSNASCSPSTPSSSSSSAYSPCRSPTTIVSAGGGSFSSLEGCRRQHAHRGHQGRQPPPPSSRLLFVTENSVSRLFARAVKAEKSSSTSRATAERLSGQIGDVNVELRDVKGQLKASESRSAAYASELKRVRGQLAAAEEETLICKENLKEAWSHIRKLVAEKKNTDKLVAACHVRVKSLEDNVMAAVLHLEGAGRAGDAAATPAATDDDEEGEAFHDSIEATTEEEARKTASDEKCAGLRDVSLRMAVRSDVSSTRRRREPPRGAAAAPSSYSDTDVGTSSLSSTSGASGGGGGGGGGSGDRRRSAIVAPERKAALDATFSALLRSASVDASAVRAEVLSDIAAARRTMASARVSGPNRGSSGARAGGDAGVAPGAGSREGGHKEIAPRAATVEGRRDQFEKRETGRTPPTLRRCGSQAGLFLSPPSLHGTPAGSPARGKVSAGVTKKKDDDAPSAAEDDDDDDDDDAKRLQQVAGSVEKRRPSIAERRRAAAAGPATKLKAATRGGFGVTNLPSTRPVVRASTERDPSVLLESPHRGGVGAKEAVDVATGAGREARNRAAVTADIDTAPATGTDEGVSAAATNATKKKACRFHPFRHRLLHPGGGAAAGVDAAAGATGEANGGGGGPPAGVEAWRPLDYYHEGDRVRSLFLRSHGLGFLEHFGVPRMCRKVRAAERVGSGVGGEVFFLEFEDPDQERAVCDFTKGGGLVAKRVYQNATEFGKTSFAKEVEILSSFISPGCHENIVMYLSVNPGAIVMEAMPFDLQALLTDKRKLAASPRTQRMGLVADAVRGLSYLHKHANITHGDVKAANMMVNASCTLLKLCDLGLAGRSHKDKVRGCTPLYAAPEVVTGFMTSSPAVMRPSMDTYAVGLVALQVLDLADEPRTSRFADELDGQPAKMCDLRDTLLEPWLWDARGGLCFEEEVTKLMMAWLSRFPPHRPPLGTLETALENEKLWNRASPQQMRRRLEQRQQDELEMW